MGKEKNEKSVLEESLIDFKKIQEMISKNSESQIKNILESSVKKGLSNIITEADDYEEEEGTEDINQETVDQNEPEADVDIEGGEDIEGIEDTEDDEDIEDIESSEEGEGMEPEGVEPEGDEIEDFDLDSFKTGEDEYDLTDKDIDDVIKVFKKVDDNDNIIVKKDDGKIEIVDDETGSDYIIDLEGETEEDLEIDLGEGITESIEDDEPIIEIDLGGELEDSDDIEDGSEKTMTTSIGANRRAGRMTEPRETYAPGKATNRDGAQLIATYESRIKKMEKAFNEKLKSLNEEASQYKQALAMFRDKLKENAVLNNNLAKYVKLVTENTTSKDEKLAILERFSKEANTIEAGNNLFESINSELSSKGAPEIGIQIDKETLAEQAGPKKINEQVIYQSEDLKEIKGLISRMSNL